MTERKKKAVLADHQRKGKRLIPPMMRMLNITETSFRDSKIPELIWISAVFARAPNKAAVDGVVEFLIACRKAISSDDSPHLSFLGNFDRLSDEQKQIINSDQECQRRIAFLRPLLWHHHALLENYPLAFIFPDRPQFERAEAIERLKQDVDGLLDRYSPHATKVQTTAVYSMMATGKMFVHERINLPDMNSIFTSPESEDAKRVGSFIRATLNGGAELVLESEKSAGWADSFWAQTFVLEGCS